MKIVMTGGGSGGHITPILAVAHEVKQLEPAAEITYIGQRGDSFAEVAEEHDSIDGTYTVRAGKFRRYKGRGFGALLDIETLGKNIRDVGYALAGLWQSFWLLGKLKPDVVFCKGGFVGVPVGLAAALRHIPYVTHDSDAIPGLANRIIGRWAKVHAVALDRKLYPYAPNKTVSVGVPVSHNFQLVTPALQQQYKKEIGLDKFEHIVLVTGGGLGAERINQAVLQSAQELLQSFPGLCIVHVAGAKHEVKTSETYTKLLSAHLRPRVIVRGFLNELYRYSGAADVIVSRGGATSFAEFAMQAKACVIVPNPYLTGGHQTKNARAYEQKRAVVLVEENQLAKQPQILGREVQALLRSPHERQQLAKKLHEFARTSSAAELAQLLLKEAQG